MNFEDWWNEYVKTFKDPDLIYYKDHMKIAFKAGWNECRDKWGGMDYDDTSLHGIFLWPFHGP